MPASRIRWGARRRCSSRVVVGVCRSSATTTSSMQGIVDERLKQPLFANTAKIYAAPREVRPGQKLTVQLHRQRTARGRLHRRRRVAAFAAGHLQRRRAAASRCTPARSRITRRTAPPSTSASGVVQSITDDHGQPLSSYELEPLLITGLSEDANRTKRRLITYDEIPPNLVQAVLAIEDRRFFEHGGVNYFRIAGRAAQRHHHRPPQAARAARR